MWMVVAVTSWIIMAAAEDTSEASKWVFVFVCVCVCVCVCV